MIALRLLFLACVASLASKSAWAEVFERDWLAPGDGLLTFDDVNNREWLDLTETQLFKFPGSTLQEQYQSVVDETMAGGMFEQFTVSFADDVFALAESGGVDSSTPNFLTNGTASDHLIQLLGNPIPGAGQGNKWAAGYLDVGVLSPPLTVEHVPSGRDHATAGIALNNLFNSNSGVWLYRNVPEPSSAAAATTAIAVFVFAPMPRYHALPSRHEPYEHFVPCR